jgi:hypothetical protein
MTAQTVSQNGNQVFRVPMWDVPAQRNGTGGYPWFIDGSSSTFVYIKNVTGIDQDYTFSLTYDGGEYATGVRTIGPSQTVVFDIQAFKRESSAGPKKANDSSRCNARENNMVSARS